MPESEAAGEGQSWNLVFFPQLADTENPEEVKQKLSKTLKVDLEKVEAWYASDTPTVLLKEVAKDVAERYMEAILQCGASCNIQQSGEKGTLSLVPKSRNVDFFICPSCEYEEEIERGTKFERCPKCGLVIAKWEEKMKEERENDEVRRRLMREARLEEDREEELERKREELERLRTREREIMGELGLKPPGRFWRFFEKHPLSVSGAFAILLLAASAVVLYYVDQYLERQAYLAAIEAAPSEEVRQIAPVVSAAVQLRQNGNRALVSELADVTTRMRGDDHATREAIVEAARQMMKGVDAREFVSRASRMSLPATRTLPGPDRREPVPVNVDTLGGITGIRGIDAFEPEVLRRISPPLLEHGHENVLATLTEKRMVPDPQAPETMLIVDAIDDMDGSMVVDLMNTLALDQEWDQYLARNVEMFLDAGEIESASELANRIKNPVSKIRSLGAIMVKMLENDPETILKLPMARVRLELDEIAEADLKASTLLELGNTLSRAGYPEEPAQTISEVREMLRESTDNFEKAGLASRLAVAHVDDGANEQARRQFLNAIDLAGNIADPARRLSAFVDIAKRYYDARNTTLASEILSEAQMLAATRLDPVPRSRLFGEIAVAQGYVGDLDGALMSIDNAGEGEAAEQLKSKLAESLIGLGKHYEAQSVMDALIDDIEYNRLEIRLISGLIHEGSVEQARTLLTEVGRRARAIADPSARGLSLSQYGRLFMRIGQPEEAALYFEEAIGVSDLLEGRRRAVNLGIVALDQARALQFASSRQTIAEVPEAIVRDPIESEIIATERIVDSLMPASVKAMVQENLSDQK